MSDKFFTGSPTRDRRLLLRMMRYCLSVLIGVMCCSQGAFSQAADAVFVNGNIWTVDEAIPRAWGLAVVADRILAVGSE